jgi:hypothetical protein
MDEYMSWAQARSNNSEDADYESEKDGEENSNSSSSKWAESRGGSSAFTSVNPHPPMDELPKAVTSKRRSRKSKVVPNIKVRKNMEKLLRARDLSYNPNRFRKLAVRAATSLGSLFAFTATLLWIITLLMNQYYGIRFEGKSVHVKESITVVESGNIGMHTTKPQVPFEITGPLSEPNKGQVRISSDNIIEGRKMTESSDETTSQMIEFGSYYSDNKKTFTQTATIRAVNSPGNFEINSTKDISINPATEGNLYLAQGGGFVGIGTDSPVSALDVSGNVSISGGTINMSSQVFADSLSVGGSVILGASSNHSIRMSGVVTGSDALRFSGAEEGDSATNFLSTLKVSNLSSNINIILPSTNGTLVVSAPSPLLTISREGQITLNESHISKTGNLSTGTISKGFGAIDNRGQSIKTSSLTVEGSTILGQSSLDTISLFGTVTSSVIFDNFVTAKQNVNLGDSLSDLIDVKGTMTAKKLIIDQELDISKAMFTVSQNNQALNTLNNLVIGGMNITTLKFQYLAVNDIVIRDNIISSPTSNIELNASEGILTVRGNMSIGDNSGHSLDIKSRLSNGLQFGTSTHSSSITHVIPVLKEKSAPHTIYLPNAHGTIAVSAVAPLSLSAEGALSLDQTTITKTGILVQGQIGNNFGKISTASEISSSNTIKTTGTGISGLPMG